MKIQILSDLHGSRPLISKDAELLIYAGDVDTSPERVRSYFQSVRKVTDAQILYVLGNHEFYDQVFPDAAEKYWVKVRDLGVLLGHGLETEINGVKFICDTLWTDYDKGKGIKAAIYGMNDFEFIRKSIANGNRKVTSEDFINANQKAREFIKNELASSFVKAVVITHHMPSFSLVSSQYRGSLLNGAFANDLDNLILEYNPTLWVYGHTHTFNDSFIGNTRCICNPVGYRSEKTGYHQKFIVEI